MSERIDMRIYEGAEFYTPGAADTIDLVSRTFSLQAQSRVLEIAYGTGEGSFRLAERHGCSIVGVDLHPMAKHASRRAASRGVGERVAFVMGDGGRPPVRDGVFDAAICIGAPSIVGTERCLDAMRRALRGGGMLAVSDWVWRETPVPPEARGSIYGDDAPLLTLEGYSELIRGAGFEIVSAEALARAAWDEYYAPIREKLAALRAADPALPASPIDEELRIWDSGIGPEWWRYAVFVARAA